MGLHPSNRDRDLEWVFSKCVKHTCKSAVMLTHVDGKQSLTLKVFFQLLNLEVTVLVPLHRSEKQQSQIAQGC